MLLKTDILIIGSGIAGLSAALKLAEGHKVTILTKKEAMETNTRYAQGGIASVTSGTDDFESHIRDTLTAGAGLCKREVVEQIVRDGPRLIEELIGLGVHFSRNKKRQYDLGREGGHSQRRVLHAGDTTGNELQSSLFKQVKRHPKIRIREYQIAVDLITERKLNPSSASDRCWGAYVLDVKTRKINTYQAKAVILATGGAGKVYLYTSNPDIATGDGIAMAYRAGATVSNLEFVQFHPTCLYNPGSWAPTTAHPDLKGRTFLISEAVRGEGAVLKNIRGERFMRQVHPMKELAPRDIVARAIDHEMKKTGDEYVLLDISMKDASFVKRRFPNIYKTCKAYGYDLTKGPIPVVPAAHYFCGGVLTDMNGKSDLDGLYAIGEAASTGLHGANRLASNSLLEAVALADYASKSILGDSEFKNISVPTLPPWNESDATTSDEAVMITQNWEEIRRLLWNYVGIVRTNKRLSRAKRRIDILQEEIREYYWNFKVTPDLIELRNVACVAELIVESARLRRESRGLHTNLDYPNPVATELHDTLLKKNNQSPKRKIA